MSDIDYTIAHKDNVPEYLAERWDNPGTLGESHLVYRGHCAESVCAYRDDGFVLDAEATPEEQKAAQEDDDAIVLMEVLTLMSGAVHEPIVLCKSHINAVQRHYAPVEVI